MTQVNNADAKILKMRERLKLMEKRVAKLNLDDYTKALDDAKQCEAFCDFIVKQFLNKITVTKDWRDDAESYMMNYNKQD